MFKKILSLFKTTVAEEPKKTPKTKSSQRKKVASTRIGELGEYKINIQLDQLPKSCKYLSDLLIRNPKSKTGYSQIDHVVITPFGLFVIETKNYNGEIKGNRNDKYWTVSNRFKLYNPLMQNYGHIKALEAYIPRFETLKIISMISFTMRCRFSIDPELRKIHSDELVVYDVELSEFIQRKLSRLRAENPNPLLTQHEIEELFQIINQQNITDPQIRNEHMEKLQARK